MQSALINGIALHFSWLPAGGDRPVLVFSNSLGTDFRIWNEVTSHLGGSASILRYDKRGHGLSGMGPTPYRIEDHVADLAGLLDHLGLHRVVVCGLSVGGLIAQGLAQDRPDLVRGLILCDTAAKIGNDESWNARIADVETEGLAGILDGVMARWFTPDYRRPDNPAYGLARTMFLRQDPKGYAATCAAIRDADLRVAAGGLRLPTLCVVGDQDGATPPALVRELAGSIPGSDYRVIAGCGHIPCMERPRELARLIGEFLKGARVDD